MRTPLAPPAPLSLRVTVLCLEGGADKGHTEWSSKRKRQFFFFFNKECGIFIFNLLFYLLIY